MQKKTSVIATIPPAHLEHAGYYDEFGHQLLVAHVIHHHRRLLGQHIMDLAELSEHHKDEPDHPVHEKLNNVVNDHLRGIWHIERFDAPIEHYAARYLHNKGHGMPVTQQEIDAIQFHALPVDARIAADAALKKNHRSVHTTEFEETFENLFTTQGVSALWNQAANGGTANTGAAVPGVKAWYNNAQACIGVGDSTTAAANTQFDLQAATNRLWVAMDATYPTLPGTGSNQIVFRSTFGTAQANYAWQELAIVNDNGSNVVVPGAAARSAANGSMLDRVVSNQGTKASGTTWQPSMTLSIA